MPVCIICGDEEISPRSKLAIGPNCRAHQSRWHNRPLQERLERRTKLRLYDARMAMVDDTDVIRPSKKEVSKYLNDDAYVHLTKYTWIKKDKMPEPVKPLTKPAGKRKQGKIRNHVAGATA